MRKGQGYGREMVEKAIAYAQSAPRGKAKLVELTYKPENAAAKKIYDSLGFRLTGDVLACGEDRRH
ncbi:GNAT family N-acetyltransferase [Paenibacillus silvae]|uniref:N-acetyltransferase domain-containing protein n=1 Tax=Paenibacillus silvae TaxID=1325358 RepID=A0A2W6Q7J8_9BACL|nr:GNAT family protein [Paenibacillus silvae]PZT53233.1 hypothetical protein DN757_23240 [Paenibacillus silvae]